MKLPIRTDIEKLDKLISKFSYSCMNNSKWKKLFIEILKNKEYINHCEVYDYTNGTVNEIRFNKISEDSFGKIFNDYISEEILTGEYPTQYKYIEYIEFMKEWQYRPYFSCSPSEYQTMTQDTDKIKEIISKIGLFEWEEDEESLKLFGYKK